LLLSNGLLLRRLTRFSADLVAGPSAVDSLLSSAVNPSRGDERKRKNSAAASSEMLKPEIPLAALTILGMRLEDISGVLDASSTLSVDGDGIAVICGTEVADTS
jgi:hypothetical protein